MRDHTFRAIDALVLPTAPTVYTIEQVLADPIQLNSRLGTYTNFVNLLDLCGLRGAGFDACRRHAVRRHAARAGRRGRRAGRDRPRIPRRHRPAARRAQARRSRRSPRTAPPGPGKIAIAVVGAHLSGMPLNGALRAAGRAA